MAAPVVLSASYDKQVRFWDTTSGRTTRNFTFQDSQVNGLYLIPDTSYLTVTGFGCLRIYEVRHPQDSTGDAASPPSGVPPTVPATMNAPVQSGNAPPPLLTSFESASSMNFTSVGSFILEQGGNVGTTHSRYLSSSSSLSSQLFGTLLDDVLFSDVSTVLFATSEDGHLRFFDVKASNTLRVLKDISTGAAITCSRLSPDRRFLLTGNQMGQVLVWHLPSILLSVQSGKANLPKEGETEEEAKEREERRRRIALFGAQPVQELSMDGDYSAIRSMDIDPLARWVVVATNVGKLHFLRFARDPRLRGSKSPAGMTDDEVGGVTPDGRRTPSAASTPEHGSRSGMVSPGPRESIYRSAKATDRRTSHSGVPSQTSNYTPGSMALHSSVEVPPTLYDSAVNRPAENTAAPAAATEAQVSERQSHPVVQELELEEFYSFQPHYKYILRVLISPGCDLLVTCSADYTVGRFVIPVPMQVPVAPTRDPLPPPPTSLGVQPRLNNLSIASTQPPELGETTRGGRLTNLLSPDSTSIKQEQSKSTSPLQTFQDPEAPSDGSPLPNEESGKRVVLSLDTLTAGETLCASPSSTTSPSRTSRRSVPSPVTSAGSGTVSLATMATTSLPQAVIVVSACGTASPAISRSPPLMQGTTSRWWHWR
ncbi:hypothetical protein AGDE_09803 [Angomonas deanei]|nr:hypothetical protein AGDE_09803 [Angomonas deanei]|eukprot:EPY29808.1 hypothetical protein AGDE_09803 [Angomonas deanei]